MGWLAIDVEDDEHWFPSMPYRAAYEYVGNGELEYWVTERGDIEENIYLEYGTIEKITSYKMTFDDEPVEVNDKFFKQFLSKEQLKQFKKFTVKRI